MQRLFRFLPILAICGLALILWASLHLPTQSRYTITDLAAFDPALHSYAFALNATGQVVGYTEGMHGKPGYAFLYSAGARLELGPPLHSGQAYGLNAEGVAVGCTYTPAGHSHACRFDGHTLLDLGTLGGSNSCAYAINAQNQIVGTARTSRGEQHAFLYSQSKMQDLGALGGVLSEAKALNDQGEIVGSAISTQGYRHAFLYSDRKLQDLGTLGGFNSYAYALNETGQVTGEADTPAGQSHAFLYQNDAMQDLGTLPGGTSSSSHGLNAQGEVVGSADTADGAIHAFLYKVGRVQDLNRLIPPDSGWVLEEARGINDRGQIVGVGTFQGKPRAFLLEPR
jgi:probable HAF family extracellular repeat protein